MTGEGRIDQEARYNKVNEKRALTPACPYTPTELERQVAILLQELRANLIEWYALDDNVLGGRVLVDIVFRKDLAGPDGVVAGNRADDRCGPGNITHKSGACEGGGVECALDYSHVGVGLEVEAKVESKKGTESSR